MGVTMDDKIILLGHGSGGGMSHELIRDVFLRHFKSPLLIPLEDSALLPANRSRVVFTTDSYVVKPLFFPGGDIGRLAVCGTVNDLSMRGAKPLYLSAGFIVEEGFRIQDLERIVQSMDEAAREADVAIVCGDTKVVEKHAADSLFINTSGIGIVPDDVDISVKNARPGDTIIISGTIGDHGVAILSQRQGLTFKSPLRSDAAPLNRLVAEMVEASPNIHTLRDPTRGGLATTLNEIASSSQVGIEIEEAAIPLSESVAGACEMLGLDYLYLANEGKLVATVAPDDTEDVLRTMRANAYGRAARAIGKVTAEKPGHVVMKNRFGVKRLVGVLASDQFPRIC